MMQIRPLKTRDLFEFSRILKKMSIKPKGNNQIELGIDVVTEMLSNLGDAEEETLTWLGGLVGMTPEALADADIDVAFDILQQVISNKRVRDFFRLRSPATT